MSEPVIWRSGSQAAPHFVEYARRDDPFSMSVNHFHPFYEVYALLSGSRVYFVKDAFYPMEAGDIIFIPPDVLHKTQQAGGPAHERIVVHFDDRFVRDAMGESAALLLAPFGRAHPVVRLTGERRTVVDALLRRVLTELRDKPPGHELAVRQFVPELLLHCARQTAGEPSPPPAAASPTHRKVAEVVRYLNAHYADAVRLGDLASRFGISPYYLSRLFKEATGFTIVDYVNQTRVKEAQRLLRETDLSVTAVAASVGFDNFSHFGKTFKRITRCSARAYRSEARGKSVL